MVKQDFEQYIDLLREIGKLEKKIISLEKRDGKMVFDTVQGSQAYVPFQQHVITVRGIQFTGFEVNQLTKILKERRAMAKIQVKQIEQFINGIPDSLMRQIFTMRYVSEERYTWDKIGAELGYDESTLRQKHDNYLKRQ